MAVPLTKLTQKNSKFIWNEECEKCFETLKEKLSTTPILAQPTEGKNSTIYNDKSKQGLGCVLMQEGRRRWIELLKDYDLTISYHPGEANKVADSLSHKYTGKMFLEAMTANQCLCERIKLIQDPDPNFAKIKSQVKEGKNIEHKLDHSTILWMKDLLCVLDIETLYHEVMAEAHKSKFFIHPGSIKNVQGHEEGISVEWNEERPSRICL
ncbi:uncharacterized protein [Henckelia pumila]|uniref:uncharacterized protein n=1 Tax=Henckelia pumila TaxID=405737 RepID=UPI003C6E986B